MRILMPSVVDPNEGFGGGWTFTRGLLELLRRVYSGVLIDIVPVPVLAGMERRLWQAWSFARGTLGPLPVKVSFNERAELRRMLASATRPDLVVLNGSDLLWTLPYLPAGGPVVVVAHNLEHRLFAGQVRWLGPFARPAIAKHQRFELDGFSRAAGVLFASDEERTATLAWLPHLRAMTVPPLFAYEANRARPAEGEAVQLVLAANFNWWPNREGLAWFLRRVWPAVGPGVSLDLYGPGSEAIASGVRGINGHGIVADLGAVWGKADASIAPMRIGAGVKVKVAESLYNGVPVLAAPLAAQGIVGNPSLKVLANEQEWISFLKPETLRAWSSEAVAETTRNMFAVEPKAAELREFLDGLLAAK
jgi:hypothetical protein